MILEPMALETLIWELMILEPMALETLIWEPMILELMILELYTVGRICLTRGSSRSNIGLLLRML